jgi:hypothetical protein
MCFHWSDWHTEQWELGPTHATFTAASEQHETSFWSWILVWRLTLSSSCKTVCIEPTDMQINIASLSTVIHLSAVFLTLTWAMLLWELLQPWLTCLTLTLPWNYAPNCAYFHTQQAFRTYPQQFSVTINNILWWVKSCNVTGAMLNNQYMSFFSSTIHITLPIHVMSYNLWGISHNKT